VWLCFVLLHFDKKDHVIIIIIIIINEKINVAYSPKTSRTRNKQKEENSDVFGTEEVSAISTTSQTSTSLSVAWKSTVEGSSDRKSAIPDRAATSNWDNDRRWRAGTQAQAPSRADVSRVSYAVCQVDWCCAVKTPEDEGRQLESDPLRNPEPVDFLLQEIDGFNQNFG